MPTSVSAMVAPKRKDLSQRYELFTRTHVTFAVRRNSSKLAGIVDNAGCGK